MYIKMQFTVILLFLISGNSYVQNLVMCNKGKPIVCTRSGCVEGVLDTSYYGRQYSSFEGIPYAKPPTGDFRFEPSEPYPRWRGIWKANTPRTCLQLLTFSSNSSLIVGEEDCLYINVYVPRRQPKLCNNLNVIVHIHGGGFMTGSGHQYAGPKYLMDVDFILVTFNYRLGPFGFLSTEDYVVPGNNGMKDQVLALKWIQRNIRYFGGNPNSVTITGMSSGAASAHFHYFSPLSKGLFHRGYSESGTALNPWAMQENALAKAKQLATLVNCPNQTSIKLINCLKTKSGNEIAGVLDKFSPVMGYPAVPFALVIEKEHKGAFLTQQPYKMLIDKTVADIPWIASVAEQEGGVYALMLEGALSDIDTNFLTVAPYLLDYVYTIPDTEKDAISTKIKKHYFSSSVTLESLAKLVGDRHYYVGADMAAKLQAKANIAPVYFYILKYKGEHNSGEFFGVNTENISASHGDSTFYYLTAPIPGEVLNEEDGNMVSVFMRWLLSYINDKDIKIHDVQWRPVTGDQQLQYLSIESPSKILMKEIEDLGSSSFWNLIPFEENQNIV